MELQWPLILFTTLCAWSCGVFGTQGVLAYKGLAKKSQMPALIASLVLLAVSGIAVFFHLQHWERIFNGFGHITSGITQELIAIVVFCLVAVAYFVFLRKSKDGGTVPKWLGLCAVAIAIALAAVCAHSYMMEARPAWNSVLEMGSIVGAACLLGPLTLVVIMAIQGDSLEGAGVPAVIGTLIGTITTVAYGAYLQMSGNLFNTVGYYFDPTHPTKAMMDTAAAATDQAAIIWIGAVLLGAIVPLVCSCVGRKKANAASWKLLGTVAVVSGVVGAVCLRVAFYNLGFSSFLYY